MGNPRVNRQDTPFQSLHVLAGPFQATDLDSSPDDKVLYQVHKNCVLDQVGIRALVISSANTANIRIGWAISGQTLIAAATAVQFLTAAFNIGDTSPDMVINEWVDSDDGGAGEAAWGMAGEANAGQVIPAGSQIFINCPTSAAALVDLFIDLLLREAIG